MVRVRCKEVWEGVTVVRKHDSPQEVCQLVGKCDGHGAWGGVLLDRKCDSHREGKVVRNYGYEGGERRCRKV